MLFNTTFSTSINVCNNIVINGKSMKLCVVLGYDVRISFGYRDISDMTCKKWLPFSN